MLELLFLFLHPHYLHAREDFWLLEVSRGRGVYGGSPFLAFRGHLSGCKVGLGSRLIVQVVYPGSVGLLRPSLTRTVDEDIAQRCCVLATVAIHSVIDITLGRCAIACVLAALGKQKRAFLLHH